MKTITMLTAATGLLLAACAEKPAYEIQGTVDRADAEGKYVYLLPYGSDEAPLDSALIANGKFVLKGEQATPKLCVLRIGDDELKRTSAGENQAFTAVFTLENAKMQAALNEQAPAVTGTPENDDFKVLQDQVKTIRAAQQALTDDLKSDDAAVKNAAIEKSDAIEAEADKVVTAYVMANADKFPGLCTPDESYHGLTYVKAFGKMGYITKLVAQLMRDLGSIPAPMNSFILNLGLQSLHLRMKQHCENAQRVAEFLKADERVAWVHYCGLPGDEYYELAQKYLPNGSCGVIAFGLKGDRDTAIRFMDSLDMINIVTHVADARTCVLHPASHTHRQLSDEQLREAGIAPDLIRLSVGIEDVEDILDDIKQALEKI